VTGLAIERIRVVNDSGGKDGIIPVGLLWRGRPARENPTTSK
jgi:hypothetical protein